MRPAWLTMGCVIANYSIKNVQTIQSRTMHASAALLDWPWVVSLQTTQSRTMHACDLLDWPLVMMIRYPIYRKPLALYIRSVRRLINTVWSDDLYHLNLHLYPQGSKKAFNQEASLSNVGWMAHGVWKALSCFELIYPLCRPTTLCILVVRQCPVCGARR